MRGEVVFFVIATGISGCKGFVATPPAGFATYDNWTTFRAVSPDGVMYRVRSEENKPEADLAFWKEALNKRMGDAGYTVIDDQSIETKGEAGYLLELAAPVGEQDYSYVVAVFVRGARIVIAEAAGEVTRFKGRRAAVVAAIQQIR